MTPQIVLNVIAAHPLAAPRVSPDPAPPTPRRTPSLSSRLSPAHRTASARRRSEMEQAASDIAAGR